MRHNHCKAAVGSPFALALALHTTFRNLLHPQWPPPALSPVWLRRGQVCINPRLPCLCNWTPTDASPPQPSALSSSLAPLPPSPIPPPASPFPRSERRLFPMQLGRPSQRARHRPSRNPFRPRTQRSRPSTSTDGILTSPRRSRACSPTPWI